MKNKISPQHPSQNKKVTSAEVSTSLRTWERGCWIVLLALTQHSANSQVLLLNCTFTQFCHLKLNDELLG